MNAHTRAKLLGQPYRGGYEGEGTGGGWGGGGEGGFAGGGFVPDRSDLAELNAPGASLTGGNFSTGGIGFGVDSGPVTAAAGQAWADGLSGATAQADSVIVTPASTAAAPVVSQVVAAVESVILGIAAALSPAVPLTADNYSTPATSLTGGNLSTGGVGFGFAPGPVTQADAQAWADSLGSDTPADAAIVKPAAPKTSTVGTVLQTGLNILSAVLQIASGQPMAVVNGLRSGVSMASDAFSGSPAPSVFSGNDSGEGTAAPTGAQFGGADTGGMARDAVEGVGGSPVLGFGGVVIGAPQTNTTSGGTLALPAGLAALFAPPGNTRQLYGTVQQQQPAAPAISPALALAGLAGLIFLG